MELMMAKRKSRKIMLYVVDLIFSVKPFIPVHKPVQCRKSQKMLAERLLTPLDKSDYTSAGCC